MSIHSKSSNPVVGNKNRGSNKPLVLIAPIGKRTWKSELAGNCEYDERGRMGLGVKMKRRRTRKSRRLFSV